MNGGIPVRPLGVETREEHAKMYMDVSSPSLKYRRVQQCKEKDAMVEFFSLTIKMSLLKHLNRYTLAFYVDSVLEFLYLK